MTASDDTGARLDELESKFAFAEDLLDTLNMTVFRQQCEIDRLHKQIVQLQEQLRSVSAPGQAGSLRDEIPPHY